MKPHRYGRRVPPHCCGAGCGELDERGEVPPPSYHRTWVPEEPHYEYVGTVDEQEREMQLQRDPQVRAFRLWFSQPGVWIPDQWKQVKSGVFRVRDEPNDVERQAMRLAAAGEIGHWTMLIGQAAYIQEEPVAVERMPRLDVWEERRKDLARRRAAAAEKRRVDREANERLRAKAEMQRAQEEAERTEEEAARANEAKEAQEAIALVEQAAWDNLTVGEYDLWRRAWSSALRTPGGERGLELLVNMAFRR